VNVPLNDGPEIRRPDEPETPRPDDAEIPRPARTIARKSWLERLRRLSKWHDRAPWLLPVSSFVAGWIGFVMVRRGADWARLVAMLALLGWPWLLIEPLVRRLLEKRKRRLGTFVANFVSQSLQQELLFFSLPFVIGATTSDAGQIAFAVFVGAAALVSTSQAVTAPSDIGNACSRGTSNTIGNTTRAAIQLQYAWNSSLRVARFATQRS